MITVNAVVNATRTTAKGGKSGARVTSGVIARAEADASQACISVHGDADLVAYRGNVTVVLDGSAYVLTKNDSHACWATKQGTNVEAFVTLFNVLAQTPNEFKGAVTMG